MRQETKPVSAWNAAPKRADWTGEQLTTLLPDDSRGLGRLMYVWMHVSQGQSILSSGRSGHNDRHICYCLDPSLLPSEPIMRPDGDIPPFGGNVVGRVDLSVDLT